VANAPERQQVGKEKKRDEPQQVNEKKKPREVDEKKEPRAVDVNERLGAETAWTSTKAMTSAGPGGATTTA